MKDYFLSIDYFQVIKGIGSLETDFRKNDLPKNVLPVEIYCLKKEKEL